MPILSLTRWEREVITCVRLCSENLGVKQNGVQTLAVLYSDLVASGK